MKEMKARHTIMTAITAMLLVLALWPVRAGAKGTATAGQESDSTHFVTASLVVITPGPDIYSSLGHTAIRMECPSKGLDYCFSFETEAGFLGYLKFFAGQSRAGFVPVPTQEYLVPYRRLGRGVTQYELNLTPHEKQELWRALDEDMLEGSHRKFNLLQNNCTSVSMLKIESIMDGEYFDFGRMPEQEYYINGKLVCWATRRSPWAQFLFLSFGGTEADTYWQLENKIPPELLIPMLRNTRIRRSMDDQAVTTAPTDPTPDPAPSGRGEASLRLADGHKAHALQKGGENAASPLQEGEKSAGDGRPALTGASKVLLPMRNAYDQASPVTPNIFFGALLALTMAAALADVARRRHAMQKAGRILRHSLFWLHFAVSLFLLYVTLVSGLFGVHWNWLLIPFNPLPFVVWLLWRRRPWYDKVWWAYAAVLAAFVAVVPWLTIQLLLAHYMLVATLAVLCVWRAVFPAATVMSQTAPATKKIKEKVRKNK